MSGSPTFYDLYRVQLRKRNHVTALFGCAGLSVLVTSIIQSLVGVVVSALLLVVVLAISRVINSKTEQLVEHNLGLLTQDVSGFKVRVGMGGSSLFVHSGDRMYMCHLAEQLKNGGPVVLVWQAKLVVKGPFTELVRSVGRMSGVDVKSVPR